MLSRLIQFSLSQRLFMVLATLLLTGAGWYAYRGLPIDAFPDVASTQVKVIMKAPGMTPEEVESRIAVPIEVEMLGIPKTKILRSVTKYGLVDVTIDFQDGTDIYWATACRTASVAAWRRSPHRWARCLCSRWTVQPCLWSNVAACSTG